MSNERVGAASGPLRSIRVLDLSRLVAGNMLSLQLADFGADVVKIEQPGSGDPLRTWQTEGRPLWWQVYGRNKRSVTLNLAQAEGQALLRGLLPRFDVLIESFVPGTLERWGLGPDALLALHPGLIVVRLSAWGQNGPWRTKPGFGTLVEAASGLAAMTGDPDRPPTLPPLPLADMVAGLAGANATMVALFARETAGAGGQVIDLALFEGLFSILGPLAAEHAASGRVRTREGNRSRNSAPRGLYATADGAWLAVSGSTPSMAARFLRAYGLAHLLDDPRFATNEARLRHRDELDAAISTAIGARTLAENQAIIDREGLTAIPVGTVADVIAEPHWRARRLTVDLPAAGGTVRQHRPVPHLSATPGEIRWAGPLLGADTHAVLAHELRLDDDEIDRLQTAGII